MTGERSRNMDAILSQHLEDDLRIQTLILEKLEGIEERQASMLEMLTVFNNLKGFGATMWWLAKLATGAVVFAGSLTAIGYAIKQWVKS